jgi:hypothetical protein
MGDFFAPAHLIILFFVFGLFFLVPAIFYMLTLQNTLNKCAPASRSIEPGMVWLLLIPVLNLVWSFYVVVGVAKSLGSEFSRRGIPIVEPFPGQPIGIAMSVCGCCAIIPFLGVLAGLANLVLWIIYWAKIAEYSRLLDLSRAVAAAPSRPETHAG